MEKEYLYTVTVKFNAETDDRAQEMATALGLQLRYTVRSTKVGIYGETLDRTLGGVLQEKRIFAR